jgi:PAS domain S-box-containing protein
VTSRLEREIERYAQFFEHAPDAYIITDAGGSVREANRAALALLGAKHDDIVGRSLPEVAGAALSMQALRLSDCLCWLLRPAGQP